MSAQCKPILASWLIAASTACGVVLGASVPVGAIETMELWPCDHEPLDNIDYRDRLLGVLFPEGMRASSLRTVVTPAFDPEWAIVIDCEHAQGPRVEYHVATENVWYANWVPVPGEEYRRAKEWSESPVDVASATKTRSIDAETCRALQELWPAVLSDPHKWWNDGGVDGTTYIFISGAGAEETCGEIWSPYEKWVFLHGLVTFVEEIRGFVECGQSCDFARLEETLVRHARELIVYRTTPK